MSEPVRASLGNPFGAVGEDGGGAVGWLIRKVWSPLFWVLWYSLRSAAQNANTRQNQKGFSSLQKNGTIIQEKVSGADYPALRGLLPPGYAR